MTAASRLCRPTRISTGPSTTWIIKLSMSSRNTKPSFFSHIVIILQKSKNSWQKSSISLRNRNVCSPLTIESSTCKSKWSSSGNRLLNSITKSMKRHKKAITSREEFKSLRRNSKSEKLMKNKKFEFLKLKKWTRPISKQKYQNFNNNSKIKIGT